MPRVCASASRNCRSRRCPGRPGRDKEAVGRLAQPHGSRTAPAAPWAHLEEVAGDEGPLDVEGVGVRAEGGRGHRELDATHDIEQLGTHGACQAQGLGTHPVLPAPALVPCVCGGGQGGQHRGDRGGRAGVGPQGQGWDGGVSSGTGVAEGAGMWGQGWHRGVSDGTAGAGMWGQDRGAMGTGTAELRPWEGWRPWKDCCSPCL